MTRALLATLLASILAGCGAAKPTDPPLPTPDVGDGCQRAETHLASCPFAKPTAKGAHFAEVCRNLLAQSVLKPSGVDCLTTATTCQEAERCR